MQNPKLKILLTGATGFVGTNFVLNLHKKYEIIALVRQSSDVSKIDKFCKIYRYDESIESIQKVFENEKIDGVVHLASLVPTSSSKDIKINELINSNILFGTYLLELCGKNKINFFINTATMTSYCNSLSYHPSSLYAASKKAFEDIMKYYSLAYDSIFTSLLLYNIYGNNDNSTRLFNILQRATNEELKMSDGSQIVDYSHILDVINAFDILIKLIQEKPNFCKDKIFSLKGKERKTLKEVVELYERILGKKLNIKWGAREKRELEINMPWEGGESLPNWEQKISLEKGFRMLLDEKGNECKK